VIAPLPAANPVNRDGTETAAMDNRFLLSAIAFQRSKQLKAGAAARIERNGHKPTTIAVLEVLANTISWSRV
jgi:DNA-directed RNA polymerase subunit K/omega